MQTRKPLVAGQFYAGTRNACLAELAECLSERSISAPLPDTIVAGIVPHAGWAYSGSVAAMVFSAVKHQNRTVDTFIIFGAAHRYYGPKPAVYDKGAWLSPLGEIPVDEILAEQLLQGSPAVSDAAAHSSEHSIEVQVPFVQHLFPGAAIVPVLTPPAPEAIQVGRCAGRIARESGKKIVCIGSTDLTHYGPGYGFTPMGTGEKAVKWATEVNDTEFINFALQVEPQKMLESAEQNYNACGAGAAAAVVAAAKELGRSSGTLLAHTNSSAVMLQKTGSFSRESVGYAAVVF
jgi:AmmeMemoRadiSam system protein B